jgi:hypothetical protein
MSSPASWISCSRAPSPVLQQCIVEAPRDALAQARHWCLPSRDPRLSPIGNQVGKRMGVLIEWLTRMEGWLVHEGRASVTPQDAVLLGPRFTRLAGVASAVAALAQDFEGAT